ncbi:MAG: hypothetical protein M5U34_01140 [Chloroflexi bacterium]|nr:hypothetical protein [Chloroflexota bacterium]
MAGSRKTAVLRYLPALYNQSLPALTLYQHVYTYALSPAVNEAEIGLITTPRDRYKTWTHWFLLYRDVAVLCP